MTCSRSLANADANANVASCLTPIACTIMLHCQTRQCTRCHISSSVNVAWHTQVCSVSPGHLLQQRGYKYSTSQILMCIVMRRCTRCMRPLTDSFLVDPPPRTAHQLVHLMVTFPSFRRCLRGLGHLITVNLWDKPNVTVLAVDNREHVAEDSAAHNDSSRGLGEYTNAELSGVLDEEIVLRGNLERCPFEVQCEMREQHFKCLREHGLAGGEACGSVRPFKLGEAEMR
mmetsp:Transcript_31796/g.38439  ORF Transcript_31796/g.38439 Transcript_31796/m.38439 type:complete len:229 (+) Transcript_31796:375-1061(+)